MPAFSSEYARDLLRNPYGAGYAHHYWSGADKSTFNAGRDLKEWHALRAVAATGLVRLRARQGRPSVRAVLFCSVPIALYIYIYI